MTMHPMLTLCVTLHTPHGNLESHFDPVDMFKLQTRVGNLFYSLHKLG